MNYTEKDFSGCLFNPLIKKPMISAYPQLKEILEYDDDMQNHFDLIIRYTCALYDKNSPLIFQEKDLINRKEVAATIAGFDPEVDEVFLVTLYESLNEFAVRFTIRFLQKFVKNRVWAMIVSAEFAFWEYTKRLMTPAMDGKSEALVAIQIQDTTHQRLESYYKELFGDDNELQKAALKTRMTAESVAKMKK